MDRLDAIMAEIRKRTGDAGGGPAAPSAGDPGATAPPKADRSGSRPASTSDPRRVRRRKQLIVAVAGVIGIAVLMPTIIAGVQGGIAQARASAAASPTPGDPNASNAAVAPDQGRAEVRATPASTASASRDGLPDGSGTATRSAPAAGASASALPMDWTSVVRGLDAARARALIARDPALLAAVDAPGSAAMARDRATIAGLQRDRLRASVVPLRVLAVREVAVSLGSKPARAVLTVEDVLAGYRLLAEDGSVARVVAARALARWRVDLVQVPGAGWRYEDVVSATLPRSR